VNAQSDGVVNLIFGEVEDLCGGYGWAKDAKHRTGMEAARHHRWDEVRRQPFHDLVAGGDAGEEFTAGRTGGLGSHKCPG